MKTTLNKIKAQTPCGTRWDKLLGCLGKTEADDEDLELMDILKHNGIADAVWALRCFDYKEYSLFVADVAESVLHIFKKRYPSDNRPEKAIKAVRDYYKGLINASELIATARDAYAAHTAHAAHATATDAAHAAYSAAYAAYSAYSATYTVDAAVYAVASCDVDLVDACVDVRVKKWEEIEVLFIKHFGEKYGNTK